MYSFRFHASHKDAYWSPLSDNKTPATYAAYISEFFRVVLRSLRGHKLNVEFPLSEIQISIANNLITSLEKNTDDNDIIKQIHYFTRALICRQPVASLPGGKNCPFLLFLALHSLTDEGNFIGPDNLTGQLAKLKYLCYNCGIVDANRKKKRHSEGMIGFVFDTCFLIYFLIIN
jgi:hypothetical protein